MSFYKFAPEDIINTKIVAYPSYEVELNGAAQTGSVYLEKKFLESSLFNRIFQGFSDKEGGFVEADGPFTASIDIIDVEKGATNKQLYQSIIALYDHYSIVDSDYTPDVTGSETTRFRVMTIPEIYYDREVLSGTFTASDHDSAGDERVLYDNGRGGIYSGSMSGTLVGNIFYAEGLVVLKAGGLNVESPNNDFGEASPDNFKWRANFKGVHNIPIKIFRCRAPAGELNATTNSTYYHVMTGSDADYKNEREIVANPHKTYITTIGLYNEDYELVGLAKVAQPVKKELSQGILFRLRMDF